MEGIKLCNNFSLTVDKWPSLKCYKSIEGFFREAKDTLDSVEDLLTGFIK
jgi:hypothetical protein